MPPMRADRLDSSWGVVVARCAQRRQTSGTARKLEVQQGRKEYLNTAWLECRV